MERREEHLISTKTVALIPNYDAEGRLITKVIEENRTFFVLQSPFNVIKNSCLYYDSDYEGKMEAAKQILKGQRMLPVLVSNTLGICFIPTQSPKNDTCIWMSLHHVLEVGKKEIKHSSVLFTNGFELIVALKRGTVNGKINRADRLLRIFLKRNARMNIRRNRF